MHGGRVIKIKFDIIAVADDAYMLHYMYHQSNMSAVILFTAIARTLSKNYITDVAVIIN